MSSGATSPEQAPPWLTTGLLVALPAVTALVVFGWTLSFGFVNWDDGLYVYQNPRVLDATGAGLMSLLDPRPAYRGLFVEYFPLRDAIYWALHALFGRSPAAFHAANVLLHAAVCAVVGPVLVRWGLPRIGALAGAMLFAVHPVHVESVAWVSALKDPFFVLLALGVFWFWTGGETRRHTSLAALCLIAGLLVKAMIVVVPAQLVLLDLTLRKKSLGPSLRRVWPLLLIAMVATIHFTTIGRANGVLLPYKGGTVFTGALTGLWSLTIYLSKLFAPVDLNARYLVDPVVSLLDVRALGGLAVVGGLSAAALFLFRTRPRWTFVWGFYVLGLSTVLGLIPINIEVADRYQYEASLALSFGLGWGAAELHRRRGPRPVLAGMVAMVAVLGTLSYQRSEVWSDGGLLWFDVLDQPGGEGFLAGRVNLAAALLQRGLRAEGIRELEAVAERSAELGPGLSARDMLAREALADGEVARAAGWLAPYSPDQVAQEHLPIFALIALHQEGAAAAQAILSRTRAPRSAWSDYVAGAAHLAKGQREAATAALSRSVRLSPAHCGDDVRRRVPRSLQPEMKAALLALCAPPR